MAVRLFVTILMLAVPAVARAQTQTVTAEWDANTDIYTTGYRLYYGTSPTTLTNNVNAGNVTSHALTLATGATYYFEVRGYNAAGELGPPSSQASITLGGTPLPPTATFTGSLIGASTASLSWSTTNATTVTINGAGVALSGSAQYTIAATTTYTLVATGPGGSVTRTATVTVPVVNCVVSAWTMQSATAWGACTAGQQTRTETWTRTVLTPPSGGGTACGPLTEQRTGTQSCAMPPTATFTGSLSEASTASLSWSTTNATTVTINGTAVALSGSVQYTIGATTTYTLVATGPGGSVTRTATVTVPVVNCVVSAWTMQSATAWGTCTSGQQTRTETWTRTVLTPPSGGGTACGPLTEQRTATQSCSIPPTATFTGSLSGTSTAVLTWQTTDATSVTINGTAVALSGSTQYTISAATTYTLVATGAGGSVTRTATVTPTLAPVDCVVSAWSFYTATSWGLCTGGQQSRTETWRRTIITSPANGGAACGPLEEQRVTTQACVAAPTLPGAPVNVKAVVSGRTVTISWSPNPAGGAPGGYFVSAGTAAGSSDRAASVSVGLQTSVSATMDRGVYYARVRAVNSIGTSPDSEEVSFTIGAGKKPRQPGALTGSLQDGVVTLSWSAPVADGETGEPVGYVIEAGSAAGLANLASIGVGGTSFQAGSIPAGVYYVRVRAVNDLGASDPSEEITLRSGTAIGAPLALAASGDGNFVELTWEAPRTGEVPAGYLIEAGSAPGLANLATLRLGAGLRFATTAPPGVYYVRVRAVGADGSAGAASNEIVVRK